MNEFKNYSETSKDMIGLAHKALEQLMIEKMKQVYEKTPSGKMSKSAKLVVDHVIKCLDAKMAGYPMGQMDMEQFEQKLNAAFT